MSRFFSSRHASLVPYTPGEQPKVLNVTKLNTNECPFPPSEKALRFAAENTRPLNLYPELQFVDIRGRLAGLYGISPDNFVLGNGSDELLNFAFMAFCDDQKQAAFPNISYGFYPVYAELNHVPYLEIPLREDFSIAPEDYFNLGRTIFIANPNAPTGMALTRAQVDEIVKRNPDSVVVIDEAYVDFGAESSLPLLGKYDNLLIVQTFSKSRSLAGARLGFGVSSKEIISDLNTIRNSTNPYNINSMTMAAGVGVLENEAYTKKNCEQIIVNRRYTEEQLKAKGFELTDSSANFIFMKHPEVDGAKIYEEMKRRGVLIRHFTKPRMAQYNRVTIGSREQMDIFLKVLREIIEERK